MLLIYPVGEFTKAKDVDQLQSLIIPYLVIVSLKQYLVTHQRIGRDCKY